MSSTSWLPWGSTPPSKRPSSTPEWTSTWGSRWTLKAPSLELISEKPPLVGLSCSYLVSNSIGKLKGCNIVFDNFLNLRRASKAKQRIPRLSASWAPLSDQLNELIRWARKGQVSIMLPSTFFKLNLIDWIWFILLVTFRSCHLKCTVCVTVYLATFKRCINVRIHDLHDHALAFRRITRSSTRSWSTCWWWQSLASSAKAAETASSGTGSSSASTTTRPSTSSSKDQVRALDQSLNNRVGHNWKSKQMQVALKVPWWHHNSTKVFRLARQCMGLMGLSLHIFYTKVNSLSVYGPKVDTLIYCRSLECPAFFY